MRKSNTVRKGRIEFYNDTSEKPRRPGCRTATIHHLRCFQNGQGAEPGGWWVMTMHKDNGMPELAGPFSTLAEADRIGRAQAERLDCTFIPATPEEIVKAEITEAK